MNFPVPLVIFQLLRAHRMNYKCLGTSGVTSWTTTCVKAVSVLVMASDDFCRGEIKHQSCGIALFFTSVETAASCASCKLQITASLTIWYKSGAGPADRSSLDCDARLYLQGYRQY
jgi:hypothetical protein